MDMHVGSANLITSGDVTVPYGSLRLWDTSTGWAQINTGPGTYDWTNLDGFVAAAPAGVDLLYNLARTPTWASSQPTDSTCSYDTSEQGGPGQCDPPSDLNADGSGTNQDWINWVTAVATRNATQYNNKIKYFEIWNEWNIALFWNPQFATTAQLVRMEQDARCVVEGPPSGASCNPNSTFPSGTAINPAAKIVSPSPVGAQTIPNAVQMNLQNYFGTSVNGVAGGTFADAIGFHGYVGTQSSSDPCPNPEEVTTVVGDMASIMPGSPGAGKPWFDTEDGWSKAPDEGFTDPDRQAAFLGRYLLLQASMGVAREYWYRWDATNDYSGALWSPTGGVTEAGTADGELYNWITGNSFLAPGCTPNAGTSVWSCALSNSSGWKGLAVWDASQDCDNGTCTYSTFTVPAGGYTQYLDLAGNTTSVGGPTVQIGAKPILLENGTLP